MPHLHLFEPKAEKDKRHKEKTELYQSLSETIPTLVANTVDENKSLALIKKKYHEVNPKHLKTEPLNQLKKLVNAFQHKDTNKDVEVSTLHPSVTVHPNHHDESLLIEPPTPASHHQQQVHPLPKEDIHHSQETVPAEVKEHHNFFHHLFHHHDQHHAPTPIDQHQPHQNHDPAPVNQHAQPLVQGQEQVDDPVHVMANPHPIVQDEKPILDTLKNELIGACGCVLEKLYQDLMPNNLSTCDLAELKKAKSTLPDDEIYLIEQDYLSFYQHLIAYEEQRREILTIINAMEKVSDENAVKNLIKAFHDVEKRTNDVLKLTSNKITIKRELVRSLLKDEQILSDVLLPLTAKLHKEKHEAKNDFLMLSAEGIYVNANLPQWKPFAEEKYAGEAKLLPLPDQLLSDYFHIYVVSRTVILGYISVLQPVDKGSPTYEAYNESVIRIINLIAASANDRNTIADKIKNRKDFITTRNTLKNHLCLDKNNYQHVERWSQENNPCWHGYGGIEITVKNKDGEEKKFRIPTHAHQMMEVITKDFDDVESFEAAFNAARTKRNRYFFNPFSFSTRSTLTQMVYEDGNIKELEPFKSVVI